MTGAAEQTAAARSAAPAGFHAQPHDVVQVDKLTKIYSKPGTSVEVTALRNVDLSIQRGEYLAICGASGSGKSTLLNILGCLDRPTTGRYLLGSEDVSKKSDDELSEIRSLHLGFVFQNFNLIPQLSVLENVAVPLFYRGVPATQRKATATEVIEIVGLADRAHHRPNELSGGQMQRVAIARALVNDPLVILADEPTGNLDSETGRKILDVFDNLNKQGKTILMVTHEPEVASRCKRVIVLRDGAIIDDSRPDRSEKPYVFPSR